MTNEEFLNAPSTIPVQAASNVQKGLADITVTTKDGRVFHLGKPTSIFFPLRLWLYKFRRRHELATGAI